MGKTWVDTKNSDDAAALSTHLERLHLQYPETSSCSIDRIQEILFELFLNRKGNASTPDEEADHASHSSAETYEISSELEGGVSNQVIKS
jgi:hypothetical protein